MQQITIDKNKNEMKIKEGDEEHTFKIINDQNALHMF